MALGMTNSGGLTAYKMNEILKKVTAIQEAIESGSIGGGSGATNATIDKDSSVAFKMGGDENGVYVATGEDIVNASGYSIGYDSVGFYANTGEEKENG